MPSCSAGCCTGRASSRVRSRCWARRRPLFTSWIIGYVLGVTEPGTAWHAIGVAPIFIWELSLGLWMTFKGFRKDAPLMVEAAAEVGQLDGSATSPARRIGVASKAGAA